MAYGRQVLCAPEVSVEFEARQRRRSYFIRGFQPRCPARTSPAMSPARRFFHASSQIDRAELPTAESERACSPPSSIVEVVGQMRLSTDSLSLDVDTVTADANTARATMAPQNTSRARRRHECGTSRQCRSRSRSRHILYPARRECRARELPSLFSFSLRMLHGQWSVTPHFIDANDAMLASFLMHRLTLILAARMPFLRCFMPRDMTCRHR